MYHFFLSELFNFFQLLNYEKIKMERKVKIIIQVTPANSPPGFNNLEAVLHAVYEMPPS